MTDEELEVQDLETEISEEEAVKIYGQAPEVVPDAPIDHSEEENYETGDKNI